jgi:hypothetical protein
MRPAGAAVRLCLTRNPSDLETTIGTLSVDGVFECFTCEDQVREVAGRPVSEWKVDKRTAIGVGIYEVVIDFSTRFKRNMPHVLNVLGFLGIRIHPGNTEFDTEGCILVGTTRGKAAVYNSRAAFVVLFAKLTAAAARNDKIEIEIRQAAA